LRYIITVRVTAAIQLPLIKQPWYRLNSDTTIGQASPPYEATSGSYVFGKQSAPPLF